MFIVLFRNHQFQSNGSRRQFSAPSVSCVHSSFCYSQKPRVNRCMSQFAMPNGLGTRKNHQKRRKNQRQRALTLIVLTKYCLQRLTDRARLGSFIFPILKTLISAVTSEILRISTEHIELKNSLDFKLHIYLICFMRILKILEVMTKTKLSKSEECSTLRLDKTFISLL